MQDIYIRKEEKIVEEEAQSFNDNEILDDEPLMVDNQTQTSNQVPEKQGESKEAEAKNIKGSDTSDEDSVVEVILEDKKQ